MKSETKAARIAAKNIAAATVAGNRAFFCRETSEAPAHLGYDAAQVAAFAAAWNDCAASNAAFNARITAEFQARQAAARLAAGI